MNILLVSSKYMPEYSGSGFRAHNLYKRLMQKNSEINLTVLAGSVTENSNKVYKYDDCSVNRISCKPYPRVTNNRLLRKVQIALNFKAEYNATYNFLMGLEKKPDLIHIFGQNYVSATVLNYAEKNKIPVLIELCNQMDNPHHYIPFPFKFWVSGESRSCYKFICISERLKKVCLNNGIPEEKLCCRPNPVYESVFKPVTDQEKYDIRKEISVFGKDDILISYIAKFRESKNHHFLLEVLQALPSEYKLVTGGPVVVEGPEKEASNSLVSSLRKSIEEKGLQNRVQIFEGFIDNVSDFYKMSDVYAFPTLHEALGTPMLEALASGIPVVGNRISGVTDVWIKDNENGFISELTSEEFSDRIVKAVNIPVEQMRKESEKILAVAGTEIIDDQYLQLMQEALGNTPIKQNSTTETK